MFDGYDDFFSCPGSCAMMDKNSPYLKNDRLGAIEISRLDGLYLGPEIKKQENALFPWFMPPL
jgi:hypothetical protein